MSRNTTILLLLLLLCVFFYLVDRDQIRVEVRKKNANPKETTESIDDKFFKTIRIIIIIIVVRWTNEFDSYKTCIFTFKWNGTKKERQPTIYSSQPMVGSTIYCFLMCGIWAGSLFEIKCNKITFTKKRDQQQTNETKNVYTIWFNHNNNVIHLDDVNVNHISPSLHMT